MSLAEIKKKIEADAKTESKKILDEARSLVKEINKAAEEEIKNLNKTYEARFEKERPEIARRREIVASLDVNTIELGVKQDAVSTAFKEALSQLATLPGETYLSLAENLLKRAVETGDEKVIISGSEKHITPDWLSSFNEKHGNTLSIHEEKRPIAGGFILKNDDIETDCSWDMLVRWVRDDIDSSVVDRIFQPKRR